MKKLVKVSLFSMLAFASIALSSCNAQAPKANLKNDIDSISYAQGVMYGAQVERMLPQVGLDNTYKDEFIKGFIKGMKANPKNDQEKAEIFGELMGIQFGGLALPEMSSQIFEGDSTLSLNRNNFASGYIAMNDDPEAALIKMDQAEEYLNAAMEKIRSAQMEKEYAKEKEENAAFLEQNKSKEGVITLPSGLQYKVITEGTGEKPSATDQVKVHYTGTNINGEEFDSSVGGEPVVFPLNQVIRGWTEGIQLMPVGSKYIFYIPYDLAYGPEGRGGQIGPFATLIFEVELQEIVK